MKPLLLGLSRLSQELDEKQGITLLYWQVIQCEIWLSHLKKYLPITALFKIPSSLQYSYLSSYEWFFSYLNVFMSIFAENWERRIADVIFTLPLLSFTSQKGNVGIIYKTCSWRNWRLILSIIYTSTSRRHDTFLYYKQLKS